MSKKEYRKYNIVTTEYRPWGSFEILHEEKICKVKKIIVKPGCRLSYQSHQLRQEQWTVIKGALVVVLDDEHHIVCEGESIYIPRFAKHRAWNKLDKDCEFIEVQTGTYFGEDDIVRYEDDYNRK